MEQGTQEWLEWRRGKIGASDAPAVMGKSPYLSRHDLYEVKTGIREEKEISEFAKAKGGQVEAALRARYSIHTGLNFVPRLAEHDKYPFLAASLDGHDEATGRIIEVKFVGKDKYENIQSDGDATDGKIPMPDHHFIQCQHQMLVTGAKAVEYLFSHDGENYKLKTVEADPLFQVELLDALLGFWKHVQEKTDPGLEPSDMHPVTDKATLALLRKWKRLAVPHDKKAKEIKALEDEIKDRLKFAKMSGAGVSVVKFSAKGAIDYSKVPQLSGVNLEAYRKKSSTRTTFSVEKEG